MMQHEKPLAVMERSVMLSMANSSGHLFGGRLMAWMDELAGITAHRFAWTRVTTAAVKSMNFYVPIHYGRVLKLEGRVVRVGGSSMDIEIQVFLEPEEENGIWVKAADAVFVYVSLNDAGRPIRIRRNLDGSGRV
ncbi:MAG: acyl-CoA thioesterase [Acidaminococcus sp.]|jgi:acyl-CoA thioesterase YciA|nr:acyl-CoA thioesterase [Acidaminococcus sp.]MCI2100333.1 acyl-CoA thioesterase [Acidaminococcus sp.]MCI2114654.1 acyl-CoA thioesterase [Acidaminococcus sp.]MCI2116694.1 acyl-CoA thioesterase [Acidaminococcus sp.]